MNVTVGKRYGFFIIFLKLQSGNIPKNDFRLRMVKKKYRIFSLVFFTAFLRAGNPSITLYFT